MLGNTSSIPLVRSALPMHFLKYNLVILCLFTSMMAIGQDQIIMATGVTIECKITEVRGGMVTFNYQGISRIASGNAISAFTWGGNPYTTGPIRRVPKERTHPRGRGFVVGLKLSTGVTYRLPYSKADHTDEAISYFNDVDRPNIGYVLGIQLGYRSPKHFGFSTGLYYADVGFRSTKKYRNEFTNELIHWTITRSLKSIDLPLLLTFVFGKQKIRWSSELGVVTNFIVSNTEKMIYESSAFSEVHEDLYKKPFILTFSSAISTGVEVPFNAQFGLRIAPEFSCQVRRIPEDYRRHNIWYLGVGLTFYYNKGH